MHKHLPRNFTGPVRGSQAWWRGLEPTLASQLDAAEPKETRKKKKGTSPQESDPQIRQDLVARVRKEIEAGTYDSPEKWEAALDCLLERLGED
jgi:hypothetical protein